MEVTCKETLVRNKIIIVSGEKCQAIIVHNELGNKVDLYQNGKKVVRLSKEEFTKLFDANRKP